MKKILGAAMSFIFVFMLIGGNDVFAKETSENFSFSLEQGGSFKWMPGMNDLYLFDHPVNDVTIGAMQYTRDGSEVKVMYELIPLSPLGKSSARTLTGMYAKEQGKLYFNNIQRGIYVMKVTNLSQGPVSGNFYAFY
ncbi:hypothetical protein ACH0CQ_20055 [Bacillus sp. 179-I 2A5 NHS]|uniref:Uncharacterized protein n=1 Tax=Bacillus cereus TaxID=1396 RepID=A0A2C1LXB7_BACCE|nr:MULTISPECIES: hypothetical protein [Bacillus]PER29697.1 hypothetical protein CN476_02130 [Bacillus cereus]PGU02874.1 hypothetical protein COD19_11205 [Bacillus cereus]PGZ74683.1 hypothetical protein COE49_08405 [Bacillus sp. AFS029637]